MRDDEILVTAWLREEIDHDGSCNAECAMVIQVARLDDPLPELPIVSVPALGSAAANRATRHEAQRQLAG